MIERRAFVASIVAMLAAHGTAAAQTRSPYRIGWLNFAGAPPRDTFRDALRSLGYVEGKTMMFEARMAHGIREQLPDLASDLVRARVHVIVAVAPPAIRAAQSVTTTVPIVMAYWGGPDVVESGIVASRTRPGGNITGVDMLNTALDGKRVELLLEAVPKAAKIAVFVHNLPQFTGQLIPVRATAERAGVELHVVDVGEQEPAYIAAFESIKRVRADAVLLPSSPIFNRDRRTIIELAAKYRLPAIYEFPSVAQDGGLMGYAASIAEMDRQVAAFVDKILKGAKPADLPIEQPTRFEFAINLKTARTLGLTIPPSLLIRADQVIE